MCLFLKTNEVKKASHDIVVYKEMKVSGDEYLTPYCRRIVGDDIISGKRDFTPAEDNKIRRFFNCFKSLNRFEDFFLKRSFKSRIEAYCDGTYSIGVGAIHFHINPPTTCERFTVIFECVIPKGSYYVVDEIGRDGASNCLRFSKKAFDPNDLEHSENKEMVDRYRFENMDMSIDEMRAYRVNHIEIFGNKYYTLKSSIRHMITLLNVKKRTVVCKNKQLYSKRMNKLDNRYYRESSKIRKTIENMEIIFEENGIKI